MSLHASLKRAKGTGGHRNVLKREERIGKLASDERWKDGDSIFGLPKVRSIKMRIKKKAKKKEGEAVAGAEGAAPAAPGAAPAAGAAAPAAGAAGAKAPAGAAKAAAGKPAEKGKK
jgi:small basic protein (TIGR04137 family)